MNWLLKRERRTEEFEALWKVIAKAPVRRIIAYQNPGKIGDLCALIVADADHTFSRVRV
jgi:hypothetical protein